MGEGQPYSTSEIIRNDEGINGNWLKFHSGD